MSDRHLYVSAAEGGLSATVAFDAAMNYALAHNGVSPLRLIAYRNESAEWIRDLRLEIEVTGPVPGRVAEPFRVGLPVLRPGDERELGGTGVPWAFDTATFAQLDESVTGSLKLRVFDGTCTLSAQGCCSVSFQRGSAPLRRSSCRSAS